MIGLAKRRPARASIAMAAVVVAALAATPAATAQVEQSKPLGPVVVLAHRGASYEAPEHTTFAYDLAVMHDSDFLECDIQLTKDEVPVCIHDDTVERTTGGQRMGRVDSFTLAELRTFDFGTWFNTANPSRAKAEYVGARVVTFEEQLDCYRAINPRLRFHVETKSPAASKGRMEERVVEVLRARGLLPSGPPDPHTSPVILQSFDFESLKTVRRLAPTLPTAWLWAAPPQEAIDGALPPEVDIAAPAYQALLADPTFVSRAHANGHEVHTYTVDDPQVMDTLLGMGVDGIFTNRPNLLRQRVDPRGTGVPASARANPKEFPKGCASTMRAASQAAGSVSGAGIEGAAREQLPVTGDDPGMVAALLLASAACVTRAASRRVRRSSRG